MIVLQFLWLSDTFSGSSRDVIGWYAGDWGSMSAVLRREC